MPRYRHAAAVLGLLLVASPAPAGFLSGNPMTDTNTGWSFVGNSLANGTYIRSGLSNTSSSNGNYSFDVYRWSYTVTSGDSLNTVANWAVGDVVVGMGGLITSTQPSGFTSNPTLTLNGGLADARIVSKFGTTTAVYSASANAPPVAGPPDGALGGLGSHSQGHGGLGSVQLRTTVPVSMLTANALITPSAGAQWQGVVGNSGPAIANLGEIAKLVFNVDGGGLLQSWQMLLNISALGRRNNGLPTPTVFGARSDQALQFQGLPFFTDGLIPAVAAPALPTPVPPSLAAGLLGLFTLGGLGFRRRR